jgi:hypothetical protein
MSTAPMFGAPLAPVALRPVTPGPTTVVKYSAHKGRTRLLCDACVLICHEVTTGKRPGPAPVPRAARWTEVGGQIPDHEGQLRDRRLCVAHKELAEADAKASGRLAERGKPAGTPTRAKKKEGMR